MELVYDYQMMTALFVLVTCLFHLTLVLADRMDLLGGRLVGTATASVHG